MKPQRKKITRTCVTSIQTDYFTERSSSIFLIGEYLKFKKDLHYKQMCTYLCYQLQWSMRRNRQMSSTPLVKKQNLFTIRVVQLTSASNYIWYQLCFNEWALIALKYCPQNSGVAWIQYLILKHLKILSIFKNFLRRPFHDICTSIFNLFEYVYYIFIYTIM